MMFGSMNSGFRWWKMQQGKRISNMPATRTEIVWQVRRKIVSLMKSAEPEKQAALRAALRGCDLVLRNEVR